ncbi:MAG: aminodeoxychorismate/anthranilate synthase component II [Lachnospiraceae bacterium]|nr:aminodeoxychorismate/anthranilate synthase component II [Lachnospiraceae bacterium]
MILIIDNYDSFTYNLVQMVGTLNPEIKVIRNDAIKPEEIEKMNPDHIILSPGPGYPADAGILEDTVRMYAGKIPIMGVCLGHQGICEVFGAKVGHAKELMHGKSSYTKLDTACPIFEGLPDTLKVARYHSLAAMEENFPKELEVVARTDDGEIMAVWHREKNVFGLQFHPESILTDDGEKMLKNFISI